jgi:membrane-bound lytic murein transglycosylase A
MSLSLLLAACSSAPRTEAPVKKDNGATTTPSPPILSGGIPEKQEIISASSIILVPVSYAEVPGWNQDDFGDVWQTWLRSCASSKRAASLEKACRLSSAPALATDIKAQRAFFEANFVAQRVTTNEGKDSGLLTGYYEPLLKGSRTRSAALNVPLYGKPDDLLSLAVVNSAGEFTRSRRTPQGLVPYWSRAELESGAGRASLQGKALLYVDDPVEALFLQIQGSGRVVLQDGAERGQQVRAAFADHNGHTFKGVGQWLVQRGEIKLEDASMQSIKAWAQRNPARLNELLAANPRYVFFREERITNLQEGPKGALGVPLTAGRSVAVDARAVPLGLPVWIDSTEPLRTSPLQRLTFAQDIGGAIVGAVRADFYWGTGAAAGEQAGRTKQALKLFVLQPRP